MQLPPEGFPWSSARRSALRVVAGWCLGLLFTVPLTAAEPEDSAARLKACVEYPLSVGSFWEFKSGPIAVQERVSRHEIIDGETCARIESTLDGQLVAVEHLAVRADGVYRVMVSGRPVTPPLKFLQLPFKPDQQWTVESTIAGQKLKGVFRSSNEKIPLPLWNAESASVRTTGLQADALVVKGEEFKVDQSDIVFSYYFVPKLGKVRQVVETGGQKTVMELTTLRIIDPDLNIGPAPTLAPPTILR